MNEPFTVTPSDNGRERLLIIRPDQEMRAWNIARALRGRWSPGLRGFHMTPARVDKWRALFAAGFDAERVRVFGDSVWMFVLEGERMTLADAMRIALPGELEEMEVEF